MNRFIVLLFSAALLSCTAAPAAGGDGTVSSTFKGKVNYREFFTSERLRVDLVLAGDAASQSVYLKGLQKESLWSASETNLIDTFGYGQYFYELFSDGKLVFSKGFCTLFDEWCTTAQATKVQMAAGQSIWIPMPKSAARLVIYRRVRQTGKFEVMTQFDIDPSDRHIAPCPEEVCPVSSELKGDPSRKVDIALVAEGYTADNMEKFRSDARRLVETFFSLEPYASRRDDFNLWFVECPSAGNGVTVPQNGTWRNTVLASMFDTFYIDRYLTVWDHSLIAKAAAGVPHDALIVVANESKYGGGGVYNSYALGTADNKLSEVVMVHEFGHSFAGLADEYYTSDVAYEDYYLPGIEPWEPNITNLTDFGSKWKDMVAPDTPVPTPADPEKWYGVVGVFEGAGYMAKGCYRPYYECRMLNNTAPGFCPVCLKAINDMIDWYVK
ncbi:MAG: peptidase M64 [Bacteroidales bacterium]|nr:peptidase M64 [Candidatus Cacconaster equifaecalis]